MVTSVSPRNSLKMPSSQSAIYTLISSLSHSIVFLYFFALFTKEGFLLSPCHSLEPCIQLDISVPFCIAFPFSFFSQLFVKSPQTTILPCCISFSWGWFWSPRPVQCYEPLHISSGTLSTRSNPLNMPVTSII